ncbi:MAG: glyoxalase/bleomycin resistance/extradiol dioxygenase family protein [Bacteroidetes bacterium]|nr:MAG: glyoxalase/bleomycin resistance/extradiol dioxygenase family protein [Bacteroidota bacterium]
MKIEHLAMWVDDLEAMRSFYMKFFKAVSNQIYVNPQKGFSSYFLSFENGARLEIMHRNDISAEPLERGMVKGLAHFAVSLGSREEVDSLTREIEAAGFTVVGMPRTTGDGYYESVVADPEGNLIELTV